MLESADVLRPVCVAGCDLEHGEDETVPTGVPAWQLRRTRDEKCNRDGFEALNQMNTVIGGEG